MRKCVLFTLLVYLVLLITLNAVLSGPLTFFMDECPGDQVVYHSIATSVIVYSHQGFLTHSQYDFSYRCILRFTAGLPKWRISMKVLSYDLPVEPYLDDSCSDHLIISNLSLSYYNNKIAVIDERNQLASGKATYVCNKKRKEVGNVALEYFSESGSHFYIGFETGSVAKGGGFKLLLTAFTTSVDSKSCAVAAEPKSFPPPLKLFECSQGVETYCINYNLTCDGMHNCPGEANSDESPLFNCSPTIHDPNASIFDRLLSLGVTASLSISVGSVLVIILCIITSICLCKKFVCRRSKPRSGSFSAASYTGAHCANSRTGSAYDGGAGGTSFLSQRSHLIANASVTTGGPYGNLFSNGSSVNGKLSVGQTKSPSHFSENVGSVAGSGIASAHISYRGNQQQSNKYPGNNGITGPGLPQYQVQYLAAPRHFASPLPVGSSVNDSGSPHNTRPSQVSSSGFGGSQTHAIPHYGIDTVSGEIHPQSKATDSVTERNGVTYHPASGQAHLYGRSTTPSSKSARSNGGSASHQPFMACNKVNNNIGTDAL